jgi:hypothetical protein
MYRFTRHCNKQSNETLAQPNLGRISGGFVARALLTLAIIGGALIPGIARAQTSPVPPYLLAIECVRVDGSGSAWTRAYVGEGSNSRRCSQVAASYLQAVCNRDVIGRSTYKSCTTLVRNEYGEWVVAPPWQQ